MSDPSYQQITYETTDAVAIIRMNRPRYRNAQSRVLREELDHAFQRAEGDADVRVVILAGIGDDFSSGHDLGTPEEMADREARPYPPGALGAVQRSWDLNVANSLRWRDLKKPTIAQVQGYCIFGGFILASVMDLIVAAEDARFLAAHLQLFTAPWDLGVRQAKRILFENRPISAREAFELGFVTEVVPRDELESTTLRLAKRIAENDPLTLRLVKESINNAQDAMGWRNAVLAAHGNFMTLQLGGALGRTDDGSLKAVESALRRDEEP